MVWPYLKVFWLSKDTSAGHSARKKKKRWEDNIEVNERLYAMEPHLRLRRFRLEQGSNLGQLDQ